MISTISFRRAGALIVAGAGLCLAQATVGAGVQFQQKRVVPSVVADASLEGSWEVLGASVQGDFRATMASLSVRNKALREARKARFYAEYLDEAGRRCLTTAFALAADDDPVQRGGTRTLNVHLSGIAPSTEPVKVRVYSLGEEPGDRDGIVRSPATVLEGTPRKPKALPSNLIPADSGGPVVSLALAEIALDDEGRLESFKLLNVQNPAGAAWFTNLLSNLRFYPPTQGLRIRVRGQSLLLLRFIRGYSEGQTIAADTAREDAWVKRYVQGLTGDEAPIVNEIRFEPEKVWYPDKVSPDRWIFISIGTEWCLETFHWVADAGRPQRAWRTGP